MPTRSLARVPNALGSAADSKAPIYVDSADNRVKVVPGGAGSTTVVVLQETSGSGVAAVVVTTKAVTAAESGKTFFLSLAAGFVTTLPAPALGLYYTFVIKTAPSGGSYTIVPASGTIIHGTAVSKDLNGATDSNTTAGTPVGTITLVDSKAQIGDRVEITTDGTNWYASVVTGGNFDAVTFS